MKTIIFITTLLLSINSYSQTALQIMQQVDDLSVASSKSNYSIAKMITCKTQTNKQKLKCTNKPRIKTLETLGIQTGKNNKDSKALFILLSPPKEAGVGMLNFSYDDKTRDNESYLYLSALGEVKRMVTRASDNEEPISIFGSEFSTEDLENNKVNNYDYTMEQDTELNNIKVWQINSIPKKYHRLKTRYNKSISWIDKEKLIPLKVQTFDNNNKQYKIFYFDKIKKINGFWMATVIRVVNYKNNRMSQWSQQNLKMNMPITEQMLSPRMLTDNVFREKQLDKIRQYKN
ncbi:MAG: outer membrane lipoprotein-sorting protein [Gammaproteobacteria bacterium]|nr:MAG: outer membrane lipoprotein-sorting protein [Gammaproteobacteria bacterium]